MIDFKELPAKDKIYYQDESVVIYCADCRDILPLFPDKSFDLVLISPPYENISGAGYKNQTKDILFFRLYSEFIDILLSHCCRVIGDKGQFFLNIKSDIHNKHLITPHWIEFTEAFKRFVFKSFIIWKYSGSFDSTNKRFHLDYEVIYHLAKSDDITILPDPDVSDSLSSLWYISHNVSERLHPTQMPDKLANRVIKMCSNFDNLILDPFLGSGTTAVASKILGRKCIGIEIEEKYCKIAKNRCLQSVMQLETPKEEVKQIKILEGE